MWLTILAFCFGTVNTILVQNQKCRTSTTADVGVNGELCVFPFIYKNRTYYSCTYDESYPKDFQPWCSVKTDKDGVHIDSDDGSTYGICDDSENCQIPPRYCGIPNVVHKDINDGANDDATIEQQPWMVSLGRFVGPTRWEHECGGSLITNRHVLTAAHCFDKVKETNKLRGYIMRLGIADFKLASKLNGIERSIIDVMTHPKYQRPALNFDIGVAVADQIIEFGQTIRPICLPFQPIDDADFFQGKFVNLAGWGTKDLSNDWVTTNLHIYNLKVLSRDECNKSISIVGDEKRAIPSSVRLKKLPNDLTKELACIEDTLLVEKSCQDDSGSPAVLAINGASQGTYFEQHFVLTWRLDCNHPTMIYTRISSRQVLNWIQMVTNTSPSLMVVAGDTDGEYLTPGHTALSNIELLSSSADSCQIPVTELMGDVIERIHPGTDQLTKASESDLAGLTGYFANNAAIVCGGGHRFDSTDVCYELDAKTNSWSKIPKMNFRRNHAAASTDSAGNLWVIGGYDNCNKSDTSEVYEYKPNGNGSWRPGVALPSELRESSIKDHCVVRINSTHLFMVGGTAQVFTLSDGFDDDVATTFTGCTKGNETVTYFNVTNGGGGIYFNYGWIYDGKAWKKTSEMSVARAKAACSLVEMDDGEVGILVTSGCDGFCLAPSPYTPEVHRTTEVYNLQTEKWSLRKGTLPNQLNLGKMEILDGLPTFVGGYNEDDQAISGKIYQYHWDEDEWVLHPFLKLTYPRHNFAIFQVPKNLFGIC